MHELIKALFLGNTNVNFDNYRKTKTGMGLKTKLLSVDGVQSSPHWILPGSHHSSAFSAMGLVKLLALVIQRPCS